MIDFNSFGAYSKISKPLSKASATIIPLAWATFIAFVTFVQKNNFSIDKISGLYSSRISIMSFLIWESLLSKLSLLFVEITPKSIREKSQLLLKLIIQNHMVSYQGSIPSTIIKILFISIVFFFSSCSNENINDRIVKDENFSFSWKLIGKTEWKIKKWIFSFQKEEWKNILVFSKNEDLEFYLWKKIFINWTKDKKWDFQIKKIEILEDKTQKSFLLKNKVWGFGFFVNVKKYSALSSESKTIIKNSSGEIVMTFSNFDAEKITKYPIFSEWWEEFFVNWNKWEKKMYNKQFEIWLKNYDFWYFIKIIWKNIENEENIEIFKEVLESFYFSEIVKIKKSKFSCWWEEDLKCPEDYICNLSSEIEFSEWVCIKL